MNWLKKKAVGLVKASLTNVYRDQNFFGSMFNTVAKHAGVDVNYTTAMRHSDVYTCIRIKAESLGQLPIRLYRMDKNIRREIYSGREHKIFTKKPNPYQTWQEFLETYVTSIEILGNFYAEVKRNRFGNVYEIVPFKFQNNVSANMDSNGVVYYTYMTNDGKGNITKVTYAAKDILHIKLNNTDGYIGMSPISQCAQAIGLAIAGSTHSEALFENGAQPKGVLSTDETFGDDDNAIARLRKGWEDQHKGPNNSGKIAVLEYGLKYQSIQMSSVDAQLLEHGQFSRERICSIFRVPSHMLNAPDGMKYNSIEHNNSSFFRDALMPLVVKLENNINELLPDNHTIKIDQKQFVRGDHKSMVDAIETEIKSGLCSLNEGRIDLGREPIDGGDVFAIQTNNLTFGTYDDLKKMRQLNMDKLVNENKKLENEATAEPVQPVPQESNSEGAPDEQE